MTQRLAESGPLAAREVGLSLPGRELVAARGGATREYLVFVVSGDWLALPLSAVKEILKVAPITPVPRASAEVLGILSVRGRITTVVCLRTKLGLAPEEGSRGTRILLVDRGNEVIGMRVDAVTEVLRLQPSEIEASDAIGAGLAEHVVGIGRPAAAPDEVVVLLDPVALLR